MSMFVCAGSVLIVLALRLVGATVMLIVTHKTGGDDNGGYDGAG